MGWVDFGASFGVILGGLEGPLDDPYRPRQRECAKIHALFDKMIKKMFTCVKSVKLSHPPLLWWVKGSKIENFENFCFLVFRFG